MDVEDKEPAILCDVLPHEMAQKRTLARAGLSKDRQMHRTACVANRFVPMRSASVRHTESEVEETAFPPRSASPSLEAIPESNEKLFEELFHDVKQCG